LSLWNEIAGTSRLTMARDGSRFTRKATLMSAITPKADLPLFLRQGIRSVNHVSRIVQDTKHVLTNFWRRFVANRRLQNINEVLHIAVTSTKRNWLSLLSGNVCIVESSWIRRSCRINAIKNIALLFNT